MNYLTTIKRLSGLAAVIFLLSAGPVWAQAGGHASVGLGHGEEGYLHLEEMIKHLEYSLKMPDASQDLRMHGSVALQHANGANKGSWDPKGKHVNSGGRVLATGLAVLSLEVYYRLLPMYGFGRD